MERENPYQSIKNFSASWKVQCRVVSALLLREVITRYGRHNIGFLWLFVEPMIFTMGITILWTFTKSIHGSNLPITAFAVTGYSSVLLWRNMPSRCVGAISPNLSLMYHRNVKVMDIFASRLILECLGATMSFIVLTTAFCFVEWMYPPEDLLKVIQGWVMLAWFGASLAMLLGALSAEHDLIEKFWHPAAYLLFPLSGAAFLVSSLPPAFQKVILLFPMVHGVECVRDGFFGSKIEAQYDLIYMGAWCTGLTLLGLAQMRRIAKGIIPE